MLQERMTVWDILSNLRKAISDVPLPTDVREAPAPGRHMSGVTSHSHADEAAALQSVISSEALDAVLASAMREAISPIVERWLNDHQTEVISALNPIFRRWMDERLPELILSELKEEIRRPIAQRSAAR